MPSNDPNTILKQAFELQSEDFKTYVAQTSDHSLEFPVSGSDSVFLHDMFGNSLLDFTAGIGVNNLGNRNAEVIFAIKEQLDHYLHTMVYGEHLQLKQIEYAKALSAHFPPVGDHPQQVFFMNSGNEAVDLALKMVRKIKDTKDIIAIKGGFHGRGLGAMSVSSKDEYKQGFFVDDERTVWVDRDADLEILYRYSSRFMRANLILELVQGEAGCIPLNKEWVQDLVSRVRRNGGLVIVDEIQTGYGRTGSFLAQEQYGIEADITLLGKAGGGGLPFGAVVSSKENFEKLQTPNLSHLSTFGGNPVVMAAGLATLEQLHEGIYHNVLEQGRYLRQEVDKLARSFPQYIEGMTGLGLMRGLVLSPNSKYGADLTEHFYTACKTRGLLLHYKLNAGYTLRMSPPLIVSGKSIQQAVDVLADVCLYLDGN